MKNKEFEKIRLVSCDLNGTLVHQHTMMDMIRVYFPHAPERYEKAKAGFNRQTAGLLSMKEAFEIAGPLTKGLSLRNAIEYTRSEMRFLEGFDEFISGLYEKRIYFVINSTGYSVTTAAIRCLYGAEKIHDVICNRLIFALKGNPATPLGEDELAALVKQYLVEGKQDDAVYDEILATGEISLGIRDENEKAELLFRIAENLKIPRQALAHVGDTMGDSGGITEVARNGGVGIAFNYNETLKKHLDAVMQHEEIPGKILLKDPKSERSNLNRVLESIS
jgi:phosphoserine phosphatase